MKKHTLLVLVKTPVNSVRLADQSDFPNPGEGLILIHSLKAATEAGFNKIVFVAPRSIGQELQNILTATLDHGLELIFVEKDINDLPVLPDPGLDYLASWGEAQEVLRAKEYINEPFLVISANNYYGKFDFTSALEFIHNHSMDFGIFCYPLINTLSDFGGVDRQICFTKDRTDIFAEHILARDIKKDYKGRISSQAPKSVLAPLKEFLPVSMDIFGLNPRFFEVAENALKRFIIHYQSEQNPELSILEVLQDEETDPTVNSKILILNTEWVCLKHKADRILARYRIEEKNKALFSTKKSRQHPAISKDLREHLVWV